MKLEAKFISFIIQCIVLIATTGYVKTHPCFCPLLPALPPAAVPAIGSHHLVPQYTTVSPTAGSTSLVVSDTPECGEQLWQLEECPEEEKSNCCKECKKPDPHYLMVPVSKDKCNQCLTVKTGPPKKEIRASRLRKIRASRLRRKRYGRYIRKRYRRARTSFRRKTSRVRSKSRKYYGKMKRALRRRKCLSKKLLRLRRKYYKKVRRSSKARRSLIVIQAKFRRKKFHKLNRWAQNRLIRSVRRKWTRRGRYRHVLSRFITEVINIYRRWCK